MNYDQHNAETLKHIHAVQRLLGFCIEECVKRQAGHDQSKLEDPEREYFARALPQLKASTYGSVEYRLILKTLQPALEHHYAVNRHHPEHYKRGIFGMNLIDLLEMICDWYAAAQRHDNGNIFESIRLNRERFRYDPQVESLLRETALYLLGKDKGIEKLYGGLDAKTQY